MRHPSSSSSLSGTMTTAPKTPCCAKVGLKKGPWTPEEDELLSNYINKEGEGRWRTLPKSAGLLRCGKSCRLRWMNYLRPNVKRGQIAPDEEDLILRLHRLLGNRYLSYFLHSNFILQPVKNLQLSLIINTRTTTSTSNLQANPERILQVQAIFRLTRVYIYPREMRWSLIAGRIPGRTDNEIKNYWNTHLSKKLISQGIDPRNHKPLENTTTSSTTDNNNNNAINNTVKVITHSSSKSVVNQIHQPEQPFNDPSSSASIINLEAERVQRGYTCTEQDQLAQYRRSIGDVEFISSGGGGGIENILSNPQGLRNHGVNNDFNYCSDDVFSSFLNSLMNEDVFSSIQHVQQQSSGIFSPAVPADGFEDPTTLLSSATAFNHKDPETTQLNHHPA